MQIFNTSKQSFPVILTASLYSQLGMVARSTGSTNPTILTLHVSFVRGTTSITQVPSFALTMDVFGRGIFSLSLSSSVGSYTIIVIDGRSEQLNLETPMADVRNSRWDTILLIGHG